MKVKVNQISRLTEVRVLKQNLSIKRPKYNVKIDQNISKLKVNVLSQDIVVKRPTSNIVVNQVGRQGPTGKDGRVQEITAGPGIIVDSSDPANPVVSATGGSGDKNFVHDFTMQHTISIKHDLQKYPSATVINSAGDKVESTVNYVDINNVIIQFTAPFSGRVTLN